MTKKCILCDEEFCFMELHSSAGTIIKDDGCRMYEKLLLAKRELPKETQYYESMVRNIDNVIKSKNFENISNMYKLINGQRIKVKEIEHEIDFIENDYLKNFCKEPKFAERRAKIERRVLT